MNRTNLALVCLAILLLFLTAVVAACIDDDDDDADDNDDDNDDNDCTTWTDPSTGHMWENGKEYFGAWYDAIEYCLNLSCGDYDDWRLPTIDELRSLIRGCEGTELGGSCGVSDPGCTYYDCRNSDCGGCEEYEGPALDGYYLPDDLNGDYYVYWSATEIIDEDEFAWIVNYKYAGVTSGYFTSEYSVRCVRGGD